MSGKLSQERDRLSEKLFSMSHEIMFPKGRRSTLKLALSFIPGLSLAILSWALKPREPVWNQASKGKGNGTSI